MKKETISAAVESRLSLPTIFRQCRLLPVLPRDCSNLLVITDSYWLPPFFVLQMKLARKRKETFRAYPVLTNFVRMAALVTT